MAPTIKTGSLVIVKANPVYMINQVVTFRDPVNPEKTTTHRIVGEKKNGNFITQGDANNAPDRESVAKERVVGKVIFTIPYLGYVLVFTRTLPGLILLVIIPVTIIIYDEINNIKKEWALRKKKVKNAKIT